MDVQCNREQFLEKLETVKRLVVSDPTNALLLLPRSSGPLPSEGLMKVLGVNGYGSVGVMTEFPAAVAREGTVLLPVEPLREYIETLRSETVQLWRQAEGKEQSEGQSSTWFASRRDGVPLQVESSSVSEKGKTSTSQAQLCTWKTALDHLPPIEAWQTAALPLGTVEVDMLRHTIRQCTSLANAKTPAKKEAPEMYGVLVHAEVAAIRCWATSGYVIARKYLPLAFEATGPQARGEHSSCHALFDGAELLRIIETLPEQGVVHIALVADTARPVLLFRTQQMTWFCQSSWVPAPTSWNAFSSLPATYEFQLNRRDFRSAVHHLCVGDPEALSLQTRGTRLYIKTVEGSDVAGERDIPLLVAPTEPVECLVHPRQLKQVIERSTLPRLRVQVGQVEREYNRKRETIPFLRVLLGQEEVMMSLSTITTVSQQSSPPVSSSGEGTTSLQKNGSEPSRADAVIADLAVPV